MRSSRIMRIFEQYMKNFDMNNANIKAKYFHSLKTMELARDIAVNTNMFNEEEVVVCELIGLFHDIGSFDKNPNFHIINDNHEDYTNKTLELLFTNGLIRKITNETKYDALIKFAIFSLNKNGYPNNLDRKVIEFCEVLKDAHKIDTFRLAINYPYIDVRVESYPTTMVYDEFKKFKTIDTKLTENNSDEILLVFSNTFSLRNRYSYYILRENKYINKLVESLNFADDDIRRFFFAIQRILNMFIEKKIGDLDIKQEI